MTVIGVNVSIKTVKNTSRIELHKVNTLLKSHSLMINAISRLQLKKNLSKHKNYKHNINSTKYKCDYNYCQYETKYNK